MPKTEETAPVDLRSQTEKRLAELRSEFTAGQKMLGDLEAKRAQLTETLLRISGGVQVLEEMLVEPVTAVAP